MSEPLKLTFMGHPVTCRRCNSPHLQESSPGDVIEGSYEVLLLCLYCGELQHRLFVRERYLPMRERPVTP